MHEICSLAERDEAISELIVVQYPFAQSLDEVANDVILWRDAMAEKAEVPL